jgi:hypothetical protein
MTQSDKTVRDGVMLVASYHFLLAILSLVGSLAIIIFAIVPSFSAATASKSIFMPVVGVLVGIFLAIFYGITGSGLIGLKNTARMGAVFLALFGTIGGLFIIIGAGIPLVGSLLPDTASVVGVIAGGLCGYALLTVLDLVVLAFMFNNRVRALFYGEPYKPERSANSLSSRLRSTFIDEQEDEDYEVVPVKKALPKAQPKPQPKREAPIRSANPPEELDAPGDLFTEPTNNRK